MKTRLFHFSNAGRGNRRAARAFTVMELLIVISIIAILAAISLPRLRGLGESNAMKAATKQLLDDVKFARQKAISSRSTVAIIFIDQTVSKNNTALLAGKTAKEIQQINQLQGGQFTQYALYSFRDVGSQPGRSDPHYVKLWHTLPEKTFFADYNFDVGGLNKNIFRFPFSASDLLPAGLVLPYIAFDYEGRLIDLDGTELGSGTPHTTPITLALARGAIFYTRNADGSVARVSPEEIPPNNSIDNYNHIVIDWLTGRAKLERADIIK